MPPFGAVRRVAAAEMMPLDHPFKAAPLRHANGIHVIAGRKKVRTHHVPGLHLFTEVTELADAFDRHAAEFLDVAKQWFRQPMLFLLAETKLDRFVAVGFLRLALQ